MTESTQQGRGKRRAGDDVPAGRDGREEEQVRPNPGRRRFIGGATATGFVAFTVAGRPAWANGCTLSAQMSGNTSIHGDDEPCAGEGLSPGYWRNHTYNWHPDFPPAMLFASAFGANAFPGMTLYDVITLQNEGNPSSGPAGWSTEQARYQNILSTLGMHAVAALQNAATTIRYDLTVSEVQASFRQAYNSSNPDQMELTKNSLDRLNNQGGTLA